ncbi:MAG TPA: HepT-like ribonuclease domain-containing protein [Parvibaculum sp.]|jgi:uncharacterized protein with HEPN domain
MSSENREIRLEEILEQIERIESHITSVTFDTFCDDALTQDAVERCLERICEASRKVGDVFDEKYPEVNFPDLRKFGSVLRHDYHGIDARIVWEAVTERLPLLKAAIRAELGL